MRAVVLYTEPQQLQASPSAYITDARVPPSLLISADPSESTTSKGFIARRASEIHAERLVEAGHHAVHRHFDGSTHSGLVTGFGAPGHGPTEAVRAFLEGLP